MIIGPRNRLKHKVKDGYTDNKKEGTMQNLIELLKGKKTYLVAIGGVIVWALQMFNVIDQATATKLYELLGITGLATLRAGMNK